MTIEQVLGLSPTELEKIPDSEWNERLGHYLNVTRPERVNKQENLKLSSGGPTAKTTVVTRSTEKRNKLIELGNRFGVDLEDDV